MRGRCSEKRGNHANGPEKLSKVRPGREREREGIVGGRLMLVDVGKGRKKFTFVAASVRTQERLKCVGGQYLLMIDIMF